MAVAVGKPMTVGERFVRTGTRPEGERHELVDGEIVAMAPGRNRHDLVRTNVAAAGGRGGRRAVRPRPLISRPPLGAAGAASAVTPT